MSQGAFAAACIDQARACAALGSPFTARLLRLVAARLGPGGPVADRLLAWPGDLSARGASVPLRLAGALHALVLDAADAGLAAAYAAPDRTDDATLWAAVAGALDRHAARIGRWLDSPPQTNETGRSAALIAAGHWLAARFGLPIVLSELGASAGFNLLWDRYALDLPGLHLGPAAAALRLAPDWQGPLPPAAAPQVADRAGVDLNPLDPVADLPRLLAYAWPDQPDRMARIRAAAAEAARTDPSVSRGDAAGWLEARLAQARPGCLHLVFHTIAWQYFLPATQDRCRAALAAAGARATPAAPLACLGMEADGAGRGAGLTLGLWPGGTVLTLGRIDFHGRWVEWQAPPLPAAVQPLS